MVFKKIWAWVDNLFSKDENAQIKEQEKVIESLVAENNSLKTQISQLNKVVSDLTASNKILKEQVENLNKEININIDKAQKFDKIAEFVEPEILNQLIEQAIL